MNHLYSLLVLMTMMTLARAVVYSTCEVYNQLLQRGFPQDQLPDWVCLVQSESSGNTAVVGPPNTDGSNDYGLFQINNRYWCDSWEGREGDCHVACSALLDDNIDDDATCAQLIYSQMGFSAWTGWTRSCQGQALPDVSNC